MNYPYIIIYLILICLAYAYWKKPNKRYVQWAFVLQFMFIAFRAPVVGADTWDYIRFLTGERNFYNYDSRALEVGFMAYRELLVTLGGGRFLCMLINSILSCIPLFILIKKYSFNIPLSLALFSLFNLYGVYFVALRQVLALGIIFVCVIYVMEEHKRKWFVYGIGTIVAYTFHTTAILYSFIFILTYFFRIANKKILIFGIIVSAILGVVLQTFDIMQTFNLFLSLDLSATERLNTYLEGRELNEITSLSISSRPSIIAIMIFLFMDRDKLNHWFTSIYFVGVVIGNLFVSVPMINRIIIGMMAFSPIVFTWIFGEHYKQYISIRRKINVAIIILFIYLSQAYIKSNFNSNIDFRSSNRMHPYQFIWEDYQNHPSIKYW